MKTLVIHPTDRSTDFLKPIYENIEDKTVVTTGKTFEELVQLIEEHDRVIMLGHGWSMGLFNVSGFKTQGFVIDERMVEHLNKKENIFIWCHAHVFVERNKLKGFNTDMFISEVGESILLRHHDFSGVLMEVDETQSGLASQEEINKSNNTFAELVGKYINEDCKTIHQKVYTEYGELAEKSRVADYNHKRLYYNE